jgi:hypothetical protein
MTLRPTEIVQPTNGQIIVATYDSNVLDSGRWLQEVIANTNADKVAGTGVDHLPQGGRTWLINGGMERGAVGGFGPWAAGTVAVNALSGWKIVNGTATRVSSPVDTGSGGSLQMVSSGSPGVVYQVVQDAAQLRGKTVTMRARVWGAGVQAVLFDDSGAASAVSAVASPTAFATIICSYVVGATANTITVDFVSEFTDTFWIDSVTLQPSVGALDYFPLTTPLEKWLIDENSGAMSFNARYFSDALSLQGEYVGVPWRARLQTLPASVTISYTPNPGVTDANLAGLSIVTSDDYGCVVSIVPTALSTDTYIFGATITYTI